MTGLDVVQRMLAFVESQQVPAGGPAGDLAEAWLAHVLETAHAALVLHEQGHGRVAAPLRRSVMEHALWMNWLTRHQDIAWPTVHAKLRRSVARNEQALREFADWSSAAVDAVMATENCHVPTIKELIADLVDAERTERPNVPTTNQGWYTAYWSDCESSHPSLSTAAKHTAGIPHEAMLGTTVLLALSAYSSLLPRDPWAATIDGFTQELVDSVPAKR